MTIIKIQHAALQIQRLRKARGGWALEATGALSILVLLIGFGLYNELRSNDRKTAQIAATHHKTIANAASVYIKDNYSELLDAVPNVGNTTAVSFATLQARGYVQPTLSSTNIWGQTLALKVRRASVDPKAVQLEGLVIGEGGRSVTHELGREISQSIGAEGGYTVSAGDYCGSRRVNMATLCGTRGVWQRPIADFGQVVPTGYIASALFFKDGMAVNDYLYRHRVPGKPELNTMQTYLQMGTGATAVEGQPCYAVVGDTTSPLLNNGAISTTTTGLILSCQSGTWERQIKPKPITQTYFWVEAFDFDGAYRYCPPGFFAVSSSAVIIPSGTLSCMTTIFNTEQYSGSKYAGCGYNRNAPLDTGYYHQLVCSKFQ